jgi:hypothetical protein
MPRIHPHAEATYQVIEFGDGSYGVEVGIPGSCPATIKTFASRSDAEAWIARHRERVDAETQSGRWFRRNSSSARS